MSELPKHVSEEIRQRGLTLNGTIETVSFVGVLIQEEGTCVFLPRSVQCDITEQLALASNTLKAVEKYGRESETSIDSMDEGDGRKSLNQLSLIVSLLDDFRQNGIYTRRREVRKLNLGRTDWKKTVNRVIPFPGRSGQPVYLDTHGIKRQYFNNCEIAIIHASVIHQLDINFSWIVTGNIRPIAPELRDYSTPKGNAKYQISKLKNELSQTYSDRDIRLLKLLIRYLQTDSGTDTSNFIAGLGKFHFCWEHMLGKVLKNTVSLNNKLPTPAYIDKSGNVLTANEKGMRTDIILHNKKENRYTVADAKYYAATNVRNAPGWGDIVKQLFYEKALKTLDTGAMIKNAFIFPGKEGNLKEARIRNRLESTDEVPIYINEFKPIHCFYTDPMEVIEHYLKGNKMDQLTELLLKKEA
ncbi:MAG: LlaJI family restriction endonuclease [Gammaproteobacteria bacterium]|nr:LlaJI family restriction endonuclease [Gammaproteobacteria bacterium]